MTDVPASEAKRLLPPKWVQSVLGALLAFGALAMLEFLSGRPFLPSPEWIAYAWGPSLIAGLSSSAFVFWALRTYGKGNVFHFRDEVIDHKKLLGSLGGLVLYFACGYMCALKLIPMFDAIIMGHRVETTVTVQYTMPAGSKYCRREVVFTELPFGADTICGVREDLLEKLNPGTKIVVSGRGTAWGVFADHIRIAASAE